MLWAMRGAAARPYCRPRVRALAWASAWITGNMRTIIMSRTRGAYRPRAETEQ